MPVHCNTIAIGAESRVIAVSKLKVQPGPTDVISASNTARPAAASVHLNKLEAALAVAGLTGFVSTRSVPHT